MIRCAGLRAMCNPNRLLVWWTACNWHDPAWKKKLVIGRDRASGRARHKAIRKLIPGCRRQISGALFV